MVAKQGQEMVAAAYPLPLVVIVTREVHQPCARLLLLLQLRRRLVWPRWRRPLVLRMLQLSRLFLAGCRRC
jgi:hypothetical protein